MTNKTRIDLRPPLDPAFRAALGRACLAASLAGAELDTPDAARIVEDELRSDGYPNAEISLFRSVEEVRNRVSNWVVWRDGRPPERERGAQQQDRPAYPGRWDHGPLARGAGASRSD